MIFYTAFLCWIVQEYIMKSDFLSYFGYIPCTTLRIGSIILLLIKIFILDVEYSKKSLMVIMIIAVIAIVGQFTANTESNNTLFNVLLLILGGRNILFSDICKFTYRVSGIIFLIIIILALAGVLDNSYLVEENRIRYYLGFDYVTFSSIYVINIIGCSFYYWYDKKDQGAPWYFICISIALSFWLYQKTGTRLAFGIVIIFITLYIVVVKFDYNFLKNNIITRTVMTCAFPLAGVLTYIISINYNSTDIRWIKLNELLSNRLLMNNRALKLYDVKLLGQSIVSNTDYINSSDYFFIDSGYMDLLLRNGVLVFCSVLIIYTMLLRKAIQTNNKVLVLWYICVCIYNIFNGLILSPVVNSSLFAVWMLFSNRSIDNNKESVNR
jgi:hypothetical protein